MRDLNDIKAQSFDGTEMTRPFINLLAFIFNVWFIQMT